MKNEYKWKRNKSGKWVKWKVEERLVATLTMLNRALDRSICALRHIDLDNLEQNRWLLEHLIRTVEYVNDTRNHQVQIYRQFRKLKQEIREKNIIIKTFKRWKSPYQIGIPEGFFEEPGLEDLDV